MSPDHLALRKVNALKTIESIMTAQAQRAGVELSPPSVKNVNEYDLNHRELFKLENFAENLSRIEAATVASATAGASAAIVGTLRERAKAAKVALPAMPSTEGKDPEEAQVEFLEWTAAAMAAIAAAPASA